MAVYFKYKSAKDYNSIPISDPFVSVANLKFKIFASKRFGRGKDFDLIITNAQTNDDYVDDHTLIPKNTSVLIRRVPGLRRLPIVISSVTESETTYQQPLALGEDKNQQDSIPASYSQDLEYDGFGDDVYAIPKSISVPIQSSTNTMQDAPTSSIDDDDDDEQIKIKKLVDTPSLTGCAFGRGGKGWRKPPVGYVCHRCKVPGHFIQHCPTNGDPNYDVKKMKPPTCTPNEAAFAKEVEGLLSSSSSSSSSKRTFSEIPPELYCPLCRQVMKDAVIASKCCFSSFCDKCVRDHIISKSVCVCGVSNILADSLLPNITLRASITRIMESSSSSSTSHGVSSVRVPDMALTHDSLPNPKFAPSEADALPPQKEQTCRAQEIVENCKTGAGKGRKSKVTEVSQPICEPRGVKEPASHKGNTPLVIEKVQEKLIAGEEGNMKKRMKAGVPSDAAAAYLSSWTGMQYMNYGHPVWPQEAFGGQGFMLPVGPLPHGDLADIFLPRGSSGGQNFEARTAGLKRKRDMSRDSSRGQFLVL